MGVVQSSDKVDDWWDNVDSSIELHLRQKGFGEATLINQEIRIASYDFFAIGIYIIIFSTAVTTISNGIAVSGVARQIGIRE